MTPRTFANVLKGHQVTHREKLSMHREQVMMGLMPHLKESERKKPISVLMPLPWEDEYKKLHKNASLKPEDKKKVKTDSLKVWDRADGKLKD